MTEEIGRICELVRFRKPERRAAEEAVKALAAGWGYEVSVEGSGRNHRQIVIGDPEKASILITGHYDTPSRKLMPGLEAPLNPLLHGLYQLLCAVIYMVPSFLVMMLVLLAVRSMRIGLIVFVISYLLTLLVLADGAGNRMNRNASSGLKAVLMFLESLPMNQRGHVCAVLFDDGERGHRSAREFCMSYPRLQYMKLTVCLDRVGRGDHLVLIASEQAKKSTGFGTLAHLTAERMHGRTVDSRRCVMSRDAKLFRCGCLITVLEKHPVLGMVHRNLNTPMDRICDEGTVMETASLLQEFVGRLA